MVDNHLRKRIAFGRIDRQLQLSVFDFKFRRNRFARVHAGGQALLKRHFRPGHRLREFGVVFVLRPQPRSKNQPNYQYPCDLCCFSHGILLRIVLCEFDLRVYLAVTRKSSKYVTESAFVHSPTLPASLNVSSVASIFFAPS